MFYLAKEQNILNRILRRYGLVAEFNEEADVNGNSVRHIIVKCTDRWRKLGYYGTLYSGRFPLWEECMEVVSDTMSKGILYPIAKENTAAKAICVSWGIVRFPQFKTPTELKMKLELTGDNI